MGFSGCRGSGYSLTYKGATAAIKRARRPFATINKNIMLSPVFADEENQYKFVSVQLYDTVIAHLYPDGSVKLFTGGWRTQTTIRWIEEIIAANFGTSVRWDIMKPQRSMSIVLWNLNGKLVLNKRTEISDPRKDWDEEGRYYDEKSAQVPFVEGITIGPRGGIHKPKGRTAKRAAAETKRKDKLATDIKAYAEEFVKALVRNKVPRPGAGDCFYCQMKVTDFDTGETSTSADHLLNHVKERYFVPSLLATALDAAGWDLKTRPTIMSMGLGVLWYNQGDTVMMADMFAANCYVSLVKYLSMQLKVSCNVRLGDGHKFLPEKRDNLPEQADDSGPLFG